MARTAHAMEKRQRAKSALFYYGIGTVVIVGGLIVVLGR